MKKTNNKMQLLLLSVVLLGTTACTGDFADINRNPNEVTDEQLQANNYKIGTNLKTLQGLVVPTEEHRFQFVESIVGCPYAGYNGKTVDTWQATFENYNPSADWRKVPFVDMISDTYPAYRAIINGTEDVVAQALAKLFRIAIMQRVTDSYGPIPYTQVMASKTESLEVAYDTQEEVYTAMFTELDDVIASLQDNLSLPSDAFGRYDGVYSGNISQWLKFANSLKLRMAMRLTEVKPDLAKSKAAEAIAAGVITTNADNAMMHTSDNRTTLIYNDWGDHRIGADIINYMNGYNDPRREKMFQPATITGGGFYGVVNGLGSTEQKFYTKMSAPNIFGETPMRWLLASEVAFLKAEFKLLKGDKSGAKSDYEEGIRLSFLENGLSASDAADYAQSMKTPARFIDMSENPTKYSKNALGTVSVKWAEDGNELERIITQKWIALYPNGMEAWAEFRRTGFPKLFPINENSNDPSIDKNKQIRRVIFPKSEYANNAGAVNAATRLLGGPDSGGTRLWWDAR